MTKIEGYIFFKAEGTVPNITCRCLHYFLNLGQIENKHSSYNTFCPHATEYFTIFVHKIILKIPYRLQIIFILSRQINKWGIFWSKKIWKLGRLPTTRISNTQYVVCHLMRILIDVQVSATAFQVLSKWSDASWEVHHLKKWCIEAISANLGFLQEALGGCLA